MLCCSGCEVNSGVSLFTLRSNIPGTHNLINKHNALPDDDTLRCGKSWAKFNFLFYPQVTCRFLLESSTSAPPTTWQSSSLIACLSKALLCLPLLSAVSCWENWWPKEHWEVSLQFCGQTGAGGWCSYLVIMWTWVSLAPIQRSVLSRNGCFCKIHKKEREDLHSTDCHHHCLYATGTRGFA